MFPKKVSKIYLNNRENGCNNQNVIKTSHSSHILKKKYKNIVNLTVMDTKSSRTRLYPYLA